MPKRSLFTSTRHRPFLILLVIILFVDILTKKFPDLCKFLKILIVAAFSSLAAQACLVQTLITVRVRDEPLPLPDRSELFPMSLLQLLDDGDDDDEQRQYDNGDGKNPSFLWCFTKQIIFP